MEMRWIRLTVSACWFLISIAAQGINFPDGSATTVASNNGGITGITALPATNQTCICVPTGRCTGSSGTGSVDGSGMLDVRIVTSSSTTNTNIVTGITPNIVTPATCAAGLERCCLPGGYQCGLQFPPVAAARQPAAGQAAYGEYPWQAVLLGPGDIYVGSGALIDPLNVITAAHRISDYLSGTRVLRVRLGEWDASAASEPIPAQEYTVVKYFVHPGYVAANLKNDIAMLRLASSVNLGATPTITTACLPSTSFVGQRCWVSGWGKNDFVSGSYQAIQKEVDVPVKSSNECEASLRTTRLGATFSLDANSFICAGGEAGKDACTGDGGSPLVCGLGGRFFVVGLVAWGIGCGTSNIPGVYVNVASYVPWIMTTVSSN
ncbi:phenoloxidase-activating factor 2 isoform X2 [Culex quinquefasciatus]|uniref:phenoloxidase-activating factor 2 isoform X2 n=1 Tax=Culex quinquefasciatus TaxID=7176 RepID=UPI0018E2EDD3|nr:phenoloxidase-activating factor 2 isoform X2 [Culex quinquefasciatus]